MSWLGTIFIGAVTAVVGCVLSFYFASLAARWYNISGFQGESTYYVLAFALLGLIVGFVIGFVVARGVGASGNAGFAKAFAYSLGSLLALVGIVAGVARLRADVPPTIDGEPLMIMVEARWPENEFPPPATVEGVSSVALSSVSGRVARNSRRGALWKEDAKLVDGRWVVPGAVFLYTERGERELDFTLNDTRSYGFSTPLPRRPGKKYFEWSEWYPKEGRGGPTRTTGVTFRYRVQKVSEPVRIERLGGFEVFIIAWDFRYEVADGTNTLDPYATFRVQYNGKPLQIEAANGQPFKFGMLAQLAADKPAMIAFVDTDPSDGSCVLLVDEGTTVRQQRLSTCYGDLQVEEVTNDSARVANSKTMKPAHGRIDRHTFADSKFLLMHDGILNTRTLEFHEFKATTETTPVSSVAPLGISPDEQSFVRYAIANSSDEVSILMVRDFVRDTIYELPIDKTRTPFESLQELTPAWLIHYFEWTRSADGHDTLHERTHTSKKSND